MNPIHGRITVYCRLDDGTWGRRVAIAGGRVALVSLSIELVVDEIYRRIAIG